MRKEVITIMIPNDEPKGNFESVVFFDDGTIKCSCIGKGLYKRGCKHIDKAKIVLTKALKYDNILKLWHK